MVSMYSAVTPSGVKEMKQPESTYRNQEFFYFLQGMAHAGIRLSRWCEDFN